MEVSITDAKNRLPALIRAVENGKKIVITRHSKPVAELSPAPFKHRKVQLGGMKDRIELLPGWDEPIDLNCFIEDLR
jgi:prevent-host-death family protein